MNNTKELEELMYQKHISKRYASKRLSISETSFQNKINNRTEFKASELQLLSEMLDIPVDSDVFFAKKVDS